MKEVVLRVLGNSSSVPHDVLVVQGSAEAKRLISGGPERLGGEGGNGLPQADEDEIHGGG